MRLLSAAFTVAVTLTLAVPTSALAQGGYFGRNKVQYQEFDFKTLATEHFDIYFYPEEEDAARIAARLAERWYTRLSNLLGHELRGRQPLVLYASGPHFRQTNTIEGELGEGTGGVTEAAKRRIVLPFAGPIEATDHVLGHELVHAFQYDITDTNTQSGSMSALTLPLWFIEGMAEYLSIGPVDPHTAMWMREAARREKLPGDQESRRTRSTSRIATGRRCGRSSAGSTAIVSSATSCGRRSAGPATTAGSSRSSAWTTRSSRPSGTPL